MCITQDGLPWSHAEQTRRLCAAGARWIQLRMKQAPHEEWLATAREVVRICRKASAVCIVNDSIEVALAAAADGVHLGKLDHDWRAARAMLGPERILGGTINNMEDVERAKAAESLDYVGVGPWRFTANKKNLAPLLGHSGVHQLIVALRGLPAWIIGGIEVSDLSAAKSVGAAGVAVSSALYRDGEIETNVKGFLNAWPQLNAEREVAAPSEGGTSAIESNRTAGLV